jgi:hypothetical protein
VIFSLAKSMLWMLLVLFIFLICCSHSVCWHGISAVWIRSSDSLVWFERVLTLANISICGFFNFM